MEKVEESIERETNIYFEIMCDFYEIVMNYLTPKVCQMFAPWLEL